MSLRKEAKGRGCMVRLPNICNFNSETVVLAHVRIAGVSGSDDLSALTNARTAAMGEIARALNIPLSFLAATESGTQVTLDAQRALVDQTLRPWARRIEAELMAKLLPGYRVEHDLQELLRGTMKDTAKELSKLVMGGILTPNDARWFIGMQPVKDPMADELMQRLDTAAGQAEVNGDREDEGTPNPVAVCVAKRKGRKPVIAKFSVEDAKRAGLWGKQGPWQAYPKRMMQMRARGFALRDAFPDALKGLITVEEAQDFPPEARPQPAKNIF